MMRDRGMYDAYEATWKDEDENRLRATFDPDDPEGTAVIRIWQNEPSGYWKYFTMTRQDREELIQILGGKVD